MIAVNKADGDNIVRAKAAAAEYRAALHILSPRSPNWSPPVVTYSAMTGEGIADLWAKVLDHRERLTASGELAARRGEQQVKWMWAMLEERLFAPLRSDRTLKAALPRIEADGRGRQARAGGRSRGNCRHAQALKCGSFSPVSAPSRACRSIPAPYWSKRSPAGDGQRSPRSLARRTYLPRPTRRSIAICRSCSRKSPTSFSCSASPEADATSASRPGRAMRFRCCIRMPADTVPERGVIVRGGRALQGRAPFADLLGALRSSAIPARLSRDAGRYLCNYSYWRALDRAGNGHPLVQFVHIPRVRFDPRRRRQSRSVAFRPLVIASEKLLIALIAAKRRQSRR